MNYYKNPKPDASYKDKAQQFRNDTRVFCHKCNYKRQSQRYCQKEIFSYNSLEKNINIGQNIQGEGEE